MTIDTTLRERAEAVRDAGAALATASLAVGKAASRTPSSPEELTRLRRAHAGHASALRSAQKALYRDAPPDGIILALLDEVERLRADEARLRDALIRTGRHLGSGLSDSVSTDFLMGLPREAMLVVARLKRAAESEEGGTP